MLEDTIRITDKLFEINRQGRVQRNPLRGLYIADGVKLPIQKNGTDIKKLYIPNRLRGRHFGCFGTTGSGKTRLMMHMMYQDIVNGMSIVLFDPKGDSNLLSSVIQAAAESGRLDEVMYLSPIYPEESVKIDPLAYYRIPEELIHHIVSGVQSKEEYYENVATNVSTVIICGLIAQAYSRGEKRPRINLSDVKEWITYKAMLSFVDNLRTLRNNPDRKVRDLVADAMQAVSHVIEFPLEFFSKVSSSLGTILAQMTSSSTGQIIGKTYQNEFIKRLEGNERVILICNTGNLLTRKTAHFIARILMSMMQSTVGRVLAEGKEFRTPLSIYMDEGHNVLYNGIEEMFSKGRSANVYLHFFTQDIASMEAAVGDKLTQNVLDNMNTWAVMRENDEKTARHVEELSPLVTVWRKVVNTGGGGMSVSSREETERLILKERVLSLKDRFFYLMSEGEYYKCKVPEVSDPYIKLTFPEDLSTSAAKPLPSGMGSVNEKERDEEGGSIEAV